jgi:hypothetical protein
MAINKISSIMESRSITATLVEIVRTMLETPVMMATLQEVMDVLLHAH